MAVLAILLLVCFVVCSITVWRRTRSMALLVMIGLLYNYVLHGYVVVFFHDILGFGRENYWYDSTPYFITVDRIYLDAIVVSLVFANAFLLVWLFLPQQNPPRQAEDVPSLSIMGWPLLLAATISFGIGIIPWVSALERFVSEGASSYVGFKAGEELGAYSGVFKVMFSVTAMCLCVLVLAGVGISERLSVRVSRPGALFWCVVALFGLFFFASMTALGDRVSLIGGGLGAVVLSTFYGVRKRKVVWLTLTFLVPVATIGVTREMKEPQGVFEIVLGAVREVVDNGEASTVFPQYVAMSNHIEAYSEGSVTYLFQILVPKFLSEERPEQGPYEHFAAVAGFPEQTGWGMNFMTDCYVNYGSFSVVVGAILLSVFYAALFQFATKHVKGQYIFAGAVAAYPLAIRSGIPGIKSMLVLALVGMLLYLISVRERDTSDTEDCGHVTIHHRHK